MPLSLQTGNKVLELALNILNSGSVQLFVVVKHLILEVRQWPAVKSQVLAVCSSPFSLDICSAGFWPSETIHCSL